MNKVKGPLVVEEALSRTQEGTCMFQTYMITYLSTNMMNRLLFLLLVFIGSIYAYAQEKISIVELKNGTVFKGIIKSIDPNDCLIIEIAGIETPIKVADVARVEEEKVTNSATDENQKSDRVEDESEATSNRSFVAVVENERFCFRVLSQRRKTVEIIFNDNVKHKSSHCVIPSSVEYDGDTFTVVSIGKEAFYKNKNIETLEIPGTIKTIGEEAFEYCSHLKNIAFSPGLVKIEKEAFKACPIEKIDLPNTVVSIGWRAFFTANSNIYLKSKIKWVSIPESVKEIGKQAFCRCINGFGRSFSSSCHIELLPSWVNEDEANRVGLSNSSYWEYKNGEN